MWIFYDYEEHGPENLRATNNLQKLEEFVEDRLRSDISKADTYHEQAKLYLHSMCEDTRIRFAKWLEEGADKNGFAFTGGWGMPNIDWVEVE